MNGNSKKSAEEKKGMEWLRMTIKRIKAAVLFVFAWSEKIIEGIQKIFGEIIRPIWPVIVTIVLVFAGVYVNQGRDIFRGLGTGQKINVAALDFLLAVVLYISFYLPFWRGIGEKNNHNKQGENDSSKPDAEGEKENLFLRKWQTVLPTLFILPFFIHLIIQTVKPSICFRWFEWLGLGILELYFLFYALCMPLPGQEEKNRFAKSVYMPHWGRARETHTHESNLINKITYRFLTFIPFLFFPMFRKSASVQHGLLEAPRATIFLFLILIGTLLLMFFDTLVTHPLYWLLFASLCWTGTVALLRAWTIGHTFHSVFSLIPVVLLLSFSPLRNNHEIRTLPESGKGTAITRETINALYAEYLATHPGISPIILVSEGGGLRSAYWTGLLLGAMQDRYPEFKSRIFAISTVSGGTVGANMFAALCKYPALDSLGDTLTYQATMDSILSKDFLSPVLAKALFPEVLQRFLPCNLPGISKFADRARALELSFEKAFWKAKNIARSPRDTFLCDGFKKQHQGQQIPALFINCTVAETGERGILSTVRLDTSAAVDILDSIGDTVDVPWSTAMSLSARFPGVSPGGRVFKNGKVWRHLLDGGYHDNTGLQTAREIVRKIPNAHKPFIVYIHNDADPDTANTAKSKHKRDREIEPIRWYNEITEILFGFWNVRDARAVADLKMFRLEWPANRFYDFNLGLSDNAVPVGWFLSDSARKLVKAYVERTISCDMDIESGRQMSRLVLNYPGLKR
jgi:hypothetical protein